VQLVNTAPFKEQPVLGNRKYFTPPESVSMVGYGVSIITDVFCIRVLCNLGKEINGLSVDTEALSTLKPEHLISVQSKRMHGQAQRIQFRTDKQQ
jgi:hypothetical protein